MTYILVVEDNYLQDTLTEEICIGNNAKRIRTESDFISWLEEQQAEKLPDIILIDMMLPWILPAPDMKEPVDFRLTDDSYLKAGVRCAARLIKKIPDADKKMAFFTALAEENVKNALKQDLEIEINSTILEKLKKLKFIQKERTNGELEAWVKKHY